MEDLFTTEERDAAPELSLLSSGEHSSRPCRVGSSADTWPRSDRSANATARVRRSTSAVIQSARQVKLNYQELSRLAGSLPVSPPRWWSAAPARPATRNIDELVSFVLTFSLMSFSYWGQPKWNISFRGRVYDGAWAMIIRLCQRLASDPGFFKPASLAEISKSKLGDALKGNDVEIPCLEQRAEKLRSLGTSLRENFAGDPEIFLASGGGRAEQLLTQILTGLPSFRDYSLHGQAREVIEFHKKAQLLVADLDWFLRELSHPGLDGLNKLTACADYKLPQILRYERCLTYAPELEKKIESKAELLPGSEEEIEVRAATIQAVEYLSDSSGEKGRFVSSIQVNDYLWLRSQQLCREQWPYHRTRTTAY